MARSGRTIPGQALEVGYLRSDRHRYRHAFKPGVKMRANKDGSVTFYGPRRIWADDRERGFSRYLERRHRSNPGSGFSIVGLLALLIGYIALGRMIDRRMGDLPASLMPVAHWINDTTGEFLTTRLGWLPPHGFRLAHPFEITEHIGG